MAWSEVGVEFTLDQRSNSLGGPEISFPSVCLCSFFEQLDELLSILVVEFRVWPLISFVVGAFESLYTFFIQR
jgi:hypothetical protein